MNTSVPSSNLNELILSAGVGAVATVVDLFVLTLLVEVFGLSAQWANVPALLAGALIQFLGSRQLVFRAISGSWLLQGAGFSLVELGTLVLNGALFALFVGLGLGPYPVLRMAATALVFAFFSFPLWRWVFGKTR